MAEPFEASPDPPPESRDLVIARRQCVAIRRNGQRCKKAPINGARVCQTHGGGAPQVKRRASERLREMIDPALAHLRRAMESKDMAAVVRACLGVLALNGYRPGEAPADDQPKVDATWVRSLTRAESDEMAALLQRVGELEAIAKARIAKGEPPIEVVEGVVMLPGPSV